MSKVKTEKSITSSVLRNSVTATAWTLSAVVEMGALTVQAFLKPSYYGDFPNIGAVYFDESPAEQKKKNKFKEVTIRQSLRRLEKYGFIERKDLKYIPTAKGKELLKKVLRMKKQQAKPWDKKYRVVIFDIPEEKRDFRNRLRHTLYMLDYKKLQQSVFIGKKPLPEDVVKEIKKNKLGNYVNYLLVDKVYKNVIK